MISDREVNFSGRASGGRATIRALTNFGDHFEWPTWPELRLLLFSNGIQEKHDAVTREKYKRMAVPHSFKPSLSVMEAFLAATVAFLRIFLGSLLFAFWGTYSLFTVASIHSTFWRVVAVPPLVCVFALLFGLLMFFISATARFFSRHTQPKIA